MGVAVDGWEIAAEFPMKAANAVLSTIANPKAGPESGEDAGPRKTTDFTYLGPHKPET
jgi:hypothetical protein